MEDFGVSFLFFPDNISTLAKVSVVKIFKSSSRLDRLDLLWFLSVVVSLVVVGTFFVRYNLFSLLEMFPFASIDATIFSFGLDVNACLDAFLGFSVTDFLAFSMWMLSCDFFGGEVFRNVVPVAVTGDGDNDRTLWAVSEVSLLLTSFGLEHNCGD